jgi:hypothetical protein
MQALGESGREHRAVGRERRLERANSIAFESEMYDELRKVFVSHAYVVLQFDANLQHNGEGTRWAVGEGWRWRCVSCGSG